MICPKCHEEIKNKNCKMIIVCDFIEIVINCNKCKVETYTQIDAKDFKVKVTQ